MTAIAEVNVAPVHVLLVVACPAVIIGDIVVPVTCVDVGMAGEFGDVHVVGYVACDAVGASCCSDIMWIAMAGKALGWCILGKCGFLDWVAGWCRGMAILAVFYHYVMHRIMAHPALYVWGAIVVRVNVSKTGIPVRDLILCICPSRCC
ncbi:Uncharacterised protein [uncultured archaeon]|nr:Uncharacterised protein [uncultured archaeon]